MKINLFQVDAFTRCVFGGNPAAICPLDGWIGDELMQNIAEENNLSETAFLVPGDGFWDIRWFTPRHEIDLAGHPTLAAAWVVFNRLSPDGAPDRLVFRTRTAGDLTITRRGERIMMDFPARPAERAEFGAAAVEALGLTPLELYRARDWMAVLPDQTAVREFRPDQRALAGLADERNGIIITAPADEPGVDFVSRFFAPGLGIPEDPVTGSAHCTLVPYWSARLGRTTLRAKQISKRVGDLYLEHRGDRVMISGDAVLFMEGEITTA